MFCSTEREGETRGHKTERIKSGQRRKGKQKGRVLEIQIGIRKHHTCFYCISLQKGNRRGKVKMDKDNEKEKEKGGAEDREKQYTKGIVYVIFVQKSNYS